MRSAARFVSVALIIVACSDAEQAPSKRVTVPETLTDPSSAAGPDFIIARPTTSLDIAVHDPDERPALITPTDVKLPSTAQSFSVDGDVVVEFVVERDGRVRELKVLQPLTPAVDHYVVETLRSWRYRPAYKNCLRVRVLERVTFHVEKDKSTIVPEFTREERKEGRVKRCPPSVEF